MLIWREGSCINIDVGVNLYGGHSDAAGLENHPQTAGNDPLTDSTDDTSRHQHILHGWHASHKKSQDSERGKYSVSLLQANFLQQNHGVFGKHWCPCMEAKLTINKVEVFQN